MAIVTGAGRSFVAGADIGQMSTLTSVEAKKFGAYGNGVFLKLETQMCIRDSVNDVAIALIRR